MALTLGTVDRSHELDLRQPHVWDRVPHDVDVVETSAGWEFLSHDACVAVLRHVGLGTGLRELFETVGVTDEDLIHEAEVSVNGAEGPDHLRLRMAIGTFFTPARAAALREEVRTMIDQLLADADRPEGFDIVDSVLRHIPARFFAILLGVPQDEGPFISYISEAAVKLFLMEPDAKEEVVMARHEAAAWGHRLLDERPPGDDLVNHLRAQIAEGKLTRDEAVNAIRTLLAASTDTTQGLMTNIVSAFAEHPEQWQILRENPEHIPAAVLEVARWNPAQEPTFRVALEDVEVDGIAIPKDAHVFAVVTAANRDPNVFPDGDSLDVTRDAARGPLNWSVGRHFCLGRMFAVMECEELLRAMTDRYSSLRPTRSPRPPSSYDAADYVRLDVAGVLVD